MLHELQQLNELIERILSDPQKIIELEDVCRSERFEVPFLDEIQRKKLRCWEVKNCNQSDCPCYKSDDYRCWLKVGTTSENCSCIFAQKYSSCHECEVLKGFSSTPLEALYENIHILIKHLIYKTKNTKDAVIKNSLAGLYNRKFLNMIEMSELKNFMLESVPLSIIVFDLDSLKQINDTYGYIMGDRMLKEMSAFLQKHKRESDLLFRLGGDEFMLMMNGVDETERKTIEKRLINALRTWNQIEKEDLPIPLSFSSGGATKSGAQSFDQLIAEAEEEMHDYKEFEKN